MNQTNATVTDTELAILRTLVNRTHSNNAMSGRGNPRDRTGLLRQLNTLIGNEGVNDE